MPATLAARPGTCTPEGCSSGAPLPILPAREHVEVAQKNIRWLGPAAGAALGWWLARRRYAVPEAPGEALAQRLRPRPADLLASSIDYEATLQEVARLPVPALADWCGIDLPGPHGTLEQVPIAHTDPARVESARDRRRRYPVGEEDAIVQITNEGGTFLQSE